MSRLLFWVHWKFTSSNDRQKKKHRKKNVEKKLTNNYCFRWRNCMKYSIDIVLFNCNLFDQFFVWKCLRINSLNKKKTKNIFRPVCLRRLFCGRRNSIMADNLHLRLSTFYTSLEQTLIIFFVLLQLFLFCYLFRTGIRKHTHTHTLIHLYHK